MCRRKGNPYLLKYWFSGIFGDIFYFRCLGETSL